MSTKWVIAKNPSEKISQKLKKYPEVIRKLLFSRGIKSQKEADEFLDPDFYEFHDPKLMPGINKAVEIIIKSLNNKEKIFIHGDYDVDGICSTSILWDFFYRNLKADIVPFIPSRFDEGYGMSEKGIEKLYEQGAKLIITVDCGIKDDEIIKKWSKKGIKFIVTDHHSLKIDEKGIFKLPEEAEAVVHPGLPGSKYPFKEISGATVAWKLVCALAKELKLKFNPEEYLDLVAMSVVCDIMPLKGENRSILKKGIVAIQNTKRIGLTRLINDAGHEVNSIDTYHLGFVIGPRLNAAGRLKHALDSVRLLVTNSARQAVEISEKLNNLNLERQQIQEEIYKQAILQVQKNGETKKLIFVSSQDWSEGVIGIVAGKLTEKYNRPVLIATRKEEFFTGSARSPKSFNIIEAITTQSNILIRFGGHAQAAGFTVKEENIEKFKENLIEIAEKNINDKDLELEYHADAEISFSDIDYKLYNYLKNFAPFGFENPKIKFVTKNIRIDRVDKVGKSKEHYSFVFLDEKTGVCFRAIGFGLVDKVRGLAPAKLCDILYSVEENNWNGNSNLELTITDVKVKR